MQESEELREQDHNEEGRGRLEVTVLSLIESHSRGVKERLVRILPHSCAGGLPHGTRGWGGRGAGEGGVEKSKQIRRRWRALHCYH